MAPVVVDNHVLVGSSNDLDMPGFLQSFDPESGALQWKWYATPQKAGDPGLETWKNLDAAIHGGGHPWVPGAYDPETRLYIMGTGNPTPAYTSAPRGEGLANLFTCAIVAVNVDTGKMAWYYQTSPHDTHDWDSAQTPVLVDGVFSGRQRKMAVTAARNGYFFVVDRLTGEHLLTSKFSASANWAEPELNAKGQPVRIPAKDHHVAGALVSNANQGAANWPPPSYSPKTGLFYVPTADTYAMYYLTEPDPRGALGLGGKEERNPRESRQLSHRHRLQDRQDRVAASVPNDCQYRPGDRAAHHGRRSAVCRRRLGQLHRVRSGERHAVVAHATRSGTEQRGRDLHDRRQAARAGRGGRHALRFHAVLVGPS